MLCLFFPAPVCVLFISLGRSLPLFTLCSLIYFCVYLRLCLFPFSFRSRSISSALPLLTKPNAANPVAFPAPEDALLCNRVELVLPGAVRAQHSLGTRILEPPTARIVHTALPRWSECDVWRLQKCWNAVIIH
jgi:hypothetical protein